MVKLALGILALSLTASVGLAEEMTVATPDAIKWGPAPPVFAPGMQFAVISGDPYGSGEYVAREKMPAGYAFRHLLTLLHQPRQSTHRTTMPKMLSPTSQCKIAGHIFMTPVRAKQLNVRSKAR
jgi:hypothetical protein